MSNVERIENQHNSPQRITIRSLSERARTPTPEDPDVDMDGSATPQPEPRTDINTEHQKALTQLISANKKQDLVTYISQNRINVNSPLPPPSSKAIHGGENYKPIPAVLLDIAAAFGNIDIYDQLLELGADVRLSNPLQSAVYGYGPKGLGVDERKKAIKYFIELLGRNGISVNESQFKRNGEFLKKLQTLSDGYDPMPALHMACLAGTLDAVEMLMASEADPDVKSPKGRVAIYYSSFYRDKNSKTAKAIRRIFRTHGS